MSLLAIALMVLTAGVVLKKIKTNPLGPFGIVCAAFFILSHLEDSEVSRLSEVFFDAGLVLLPVVIGVAVWRFRKHRESWNKTFPTPPSSNKRRVDR